MAELLPDEQRAREWAAAAGVVAGPTGSESGARDFWVEVLADADPGTVGRVFERALQSFPYASRLLHVAAALDFASTPPKNPIVYLAHGRQPDESGAIAQLSEAFRKFGVRVLSDTVSKVDREWATQLEQRIATCHYFVCVLSDRSVGSELLLVETRAALAAQGRARAPLALAIRLEYDGPVPYDLEDQLRSLDQVRWAKGADFGPIARCLLLEPEPEPAIETSTAPPWSEPRSLSQKSPRASAVRGPVAVDDSSYVRRKADEMLETRDPLDRTVVIKGPPLHGKTSLLLRLAAATKAPRRVAHVDLSALDASALQDYGHFLAAFGAAIAKQLGSSRAPYKERLTQTDLKKLAAELVDECNGDCVLMFDSLDRVMRQGYRNDFFSIFRLWHNERSSPLRARWRKVDLVLAISSEPHLLIDGSQSPFNVGITIDVEPFTLADGARLNDHYGARLEQQQVSALLGLVRGHPFLVQLAYQQLGAGLSFERLRNSAASSEGPFGDHLLALLARIQGDDAISSVERILKAKSLDPAQTAQLQSLGLVRFQDGKLVWANPVYEQFLARALS